MSHIVKKALAHSQRAAQLLHAAALVLLVLVQGSDYTEYKCTVVGFSEAGQYQFVQLPPMNRITQGEIRPASLTKPLMTMLEEQRSYHNMPLTAEDESWWNVVRLMYRVGEKMAQAVPELYTNNPENVSLTKGSFVDPTGKRTSKMRKAFIVDAIKNTEKEQNDKNSWYHGILSEQFHDTLHDERADVTNLEYPTPTQVIDELQKCVNDLKAGETLYLVFRTHGNADSFCVAPEESDNSGSWIPFFADEPKYRVAKSEIRKIIATAPSGSTVVGYFSSCQAGNVFNTQYQCVDSENRWFDMSTSLGDGIIGNGYITPNEVNQIQKKQTAQSQIVQSEQSKPYGASVATRFTTTEHYGRLKANDYDFQHRHYPNGNAAAGNGYDRSERHYPHGNAANGHYFQHHGTTNGSYDTNAQRMRRLRFAQDQYHGQGRRSNHGN